MVAHSGFAYARRTLPSAALALLAGLLFAPDAAAQRGSIGPRVKRLTQPQTNLARLPAGSFVPRQQQMAAGQRPVIAVTGYWPPTNEGVRRFSTDPIKNPLGWIGQDWEGRGYDIHAFFPEFTPPNCVNCGIGMGDLTVDYQDTSADFWPLMEGVDPIAIVTFSKGLNNLDWEIEMNQFNRSVWVNDFASPFQPTPAPPDAGWPAEGLRLSTQPVQAISDAVNAAALGINAFIAFSGDGGAFLSEYIAYHGVWYQALHSDPLDPSWCVAGGHVHVGGLLAVPAVEEAVKVTLRAEIDYLDSVLITPCPKPATYCTAKTTSLGCLPAVEALGYPSLSGGSFQVRATQLHKSVPGIVIWSHSQASIPFQNGTLCVAPPITRTPGQTTTSGTGNCSGTIAFRFDPAYQLAHGFAAGQTMAAQVWSRDIGDVFSSSLSNALAFVWCP
jgi:hypothetical protein